MSTDLKADLLDILEESIIAIEEKSLERLRARLQSATITEPPLPDPCVVECEGMSTWRSTERENHLVIEDDERDAVRITRTQAAALIPALQAFIGDVREGSK